MYGVVLVVLLSSNFLGGVQVMKEEGRDFQGNPLQQSTFHAWHLDKVEATVSW